MKTANYYCGTRAGKKVHVVIISDGASQVGGEGIEVSGKREAHGTCNGYAPFQFIREH